MDTDRTRPSQSPESFGIACSRTPLIPATESTVSRSFRERPDQMHGLTSSASSRFVLRVGCFARFMMRQLVPVEMSQPIYVAWFADPAGFAASVSDPVAAGNLIASLFSSVVSL